MKREIILVGDRVLIAPHKEDAPTDAGLYLPQGVKEKEKVQTGKVIKVGPGYPIPDPGNLEIEPWQAAKFENKYFSLQAREGDDCVFLRNAGVEIEFEGEKYVVVGHAAILVIIRSSL